VLAQYVDELQADWVTERLRDGRHPHRVIALDVRVDDRLAAALTGRALRLWRELQIDSHQYMNID
jgi:hypothetical protein